MEIGDSLNSALSQLGSNINSLKESANSMAKDAGIDTQEQKMRAAEAAKAAKSSGGVDEMA